MTARREALTDLSVEHVQSTFAPRLASLCQSVTRAIQGQLAAAVEEKAGELLPLLGHDAPQGLLRRISTLRVVERAEWRRSLAELHEAVAGAISYLRYHVGQAEEQIAQRDRMSAAATEYATDRVSQPPTAETSIQQYVLEIWARYTSLSDTLVDRRYSPADFRRLLVEELLGTDRLAVQMEQTQSAYMAMGRQAWYDWARGCGLSLAEPTRGPAGDIGPLVEAFLQPIQLEYERPGMIKSVFQALGRGKLEEKLTAEIGTGLEAMSETWESECERVWQAVNSLWHRQAAGAVDDWFRSESGTNLSEAEERLKVRRQRIRDLEQWGAALQAIDAPRLLRNKSEQMRKDAAAHIVRRLAGSE